MIFLSKYCIKHILKVSNYYRYITQLVDQFLEHLWRSLRMGFVFAPLGWFLHFKIDGNWATCKIGRSGSLGVGKTSFFSDLSNFEMGESSFYSCMGDLAGDGWTEEE